MRLGQKRKARRAAREETIPSAPDSVSGVALGDAEPPSSQTGSRSLLLRKRVWLFGVGLLCASALRPFEPGVGERMATVAKDARSRVGALFGPIRDQPEARAAGTAAASPAKKEEPAPSRPPSFRPGRGPLGGAVFSLPEDLRVGADGTVDVLIHFHGNTEMVLESAAHAHVGAATVVVNLGVGSGPYEERFDNPVNFTDLLTRIEGAIEKRGIGNAKLGRVALSAWSAGYGAVLRILKNDGLAAKIDAVILLDGLHVGHLEDGNLNWISIEPFKAYAERAARDETLFVITHSNIQPVDYLGVKETSDHLLQHLGITRREVEGVTALPPFDSFKGVLPKAEMIPLTRQTEAKKGSFIVRGFRGNEPHTHMAHLMEMSLIGLPDLASRWR
jgi:hypothetical protein